MGYEINLLFLWLLSSEQAIKRVALRVKQGGHNIPKEDVVRSYSRGLKNLIKLYLPISDTALILDNSEPESGSARIIARKERNCELLVKDVEIWKNINEVANVKV